MSFLSSSSLHSLRHLPVLGFLSSISSLHFLRHLFVSGFISSSSLHIGFPLKILSILSIFGDCLKGDCLKGDCISLYSLEIIKLTNSDLFLVLKVCKDFMFNFLLFFLSLQYFYYLNF